MESFMIGNSIWVTGLVYGLVTAVLVLLVVFHGKISAFLAEVRAELGKCAWPWDPEQNGLRRYRALLDSTLMVGLVTLGMTAVVSGSDWCISALVRYLVKM
jgi:preprotein translocase subunit SecE